MTLFEAQVKLTELHANYELQVGWMFLSTVTGYYARWRPEHNGRNLHPEWCVEIEGSSMERVLNDLVEKATQWKENWDATRKAAGLSP